MNGVHSVQLFACAFKQAYANTVLYLKIVSVTNLFLLNFKSIFLCSALWYCGWALETLFLCIWSHVKTLERRQGSDLFSRFQVLCSSCSCSIGSSHLQGTHLQMNCSGSPEAFSQKIIAAPLNAASQWLSPAPPWHFPASQLHPAAPWQISPPFVPPFFPNKVWVSTLVGVGERLLKVFLLEYLVLSLEVVASPLFLNSLGFFLFLNC